MYRGPYTVTNTQATSVCDGSEGRTKGNRQLTDGDPADKSLSLPVLPVAHLSSTPTNFEPDLETELEWRPALPNDDWNFGAQKKGKKQKKIVSPLSKKDQAWKEFAADRQSGDMPFFVPFKDDNLDDELPTKLICHAQLYCFADWYDVPALKSLALQKLRRVLVTIGPNFDALPDLAGLLNHTYTNTAEQGNTLDALRDLVTSYTVHELERLVSVRDFQDLLTEAGALSRDLMLKYVQMSA